MSFLRNLFRTTQKESVALINVGANSVTGAYARYVGKELPEILYRCHLPIEIQSGEEHGQAMLRSLEEIGTLLDREGIPALMRATGNHVVDEVLVALDFPWQETQVHVENIAKENDFPFTKRLVAETVQKVTPATPGKVFVDTSIMGTVLNGYEVHEPYGTRAKHVKFYILTSLVDQKVSEAIVSMMQNLYHTKRIRLISGASLRYQAMRYALPHERDVLIVDATGSLPEVALVRKGILVAVSETPEGSATKNAAQADDFQRGFAELAKNYPLPRTIFLLARDADISVMKQALESINFSALWLSETRPKITPILTNHLSGLIRQMTTVSPDLPILLMALYRKHCEKKI